MDLQLSGKTALVTGSTAGIGLAIAEKAGGGRRRGRHHAAVTRDKLDAAPPPASGKPARCAPSWPIPPPPKEPRP